MSLVTSGVKPQMVIMEPWFRGSGSALLRRSCLCVLTDGGGAAATRVWAHGAGHLPLLEVPRRDME